MKYLVMLVGSLLFASWTNAYALEVEGVNVPDSATVGGEKLSLNGAGVRTKFFMDIYIGALYLPSKTQDASAAISAAGNKRVVMHFLYSEVDQEKLVDGWNIGFQSNQGKEELARLQDRLGKFNAMFSTMKTGDEITFDFIGESTSVSINSEAKGTMQGKDFQQALLQVWLGEKPADDDLKEGMLGED